MWSPPHSMMPRQIHIFFRVTIYFEMNEFAPIYLVVDDQPWVARLTKWRLQQSLGTDINVILGRDGLEAIQLFEDIVRRGHHALLHLVLVGCHMPVFTGMEAVEVIRNMERDYHITRPVEIIGTTTDLNDDVKKGFVDAGANIVLEKPIAEGELEAICTHNSSLQ